MTCLRVISDGSVMILGDGDGQRKLTKCTVENGRVVGNPVQTSDLTPGLVGMAECEERGKKILVLS